MIGSLLQPELVELIRQRNFNQLRAILCDFPAPDIAEILGDLSADDKAVLLRILPHELATEVFEYLSVEDQEKLVQALGNEQVAQILLLFGRWTGRRGRVGLGVDDDVAQETLGHGVLECDG